LVVVEETGSSRMRSPRVSVLLSVYNGAAFVGEAIESILEQTFSDFELLVIDDGSTDASLEIVTRYRDPRVHVIRNESNLGLTRSLNIGLASARGEFVARQDADDLSHRERMRRQVDFLDANPEVALLGTQTAATRNGRATRVRGWPKATGSLAIRWQLMFDSPFVHTSVMFRRRIVWDELGGYDESFRTSQDFELWSRLAARYELSNLPEALVQSRPRPLSVSKSYAKDDVARVQDLLRANRRRWLRSDELAQAGLEAWVVVNNFRTLGPASEVASIARADSKIFQRFSVLNPEAKNDSEIVRHRAVSLARAACLGARQGARGSALVFLQACRIAPRVLPVWGVRFAASSLLAVGNRMGPAAESH